MVRATYCDNVLRVCDGSAPGPGEWLVGVVGPPVAPRHLAHWATGVFGLQHRPALVVLLGALVAHWADRLVRGEARCCAQPGSSLQGRARLQWRAAVHDTVPSRRARAQANSSSGS